MSNVIRNWTGNVAAKVGGGQNPPGLLPRFVGRHLVAEPEGHPAFLTTAHSHLDDPRLGAAGGGTYGKAGHLAIPDEGLPLLGRL